MRQSDSAWTLNGGTWTLQYTLSPSSTLGCRGLTGTVNGGVATMFATTPLRGASRNVTLAHAGAEGVSNAPC